MHKIDKNMKQRDEERQILLYMYKNDNYLGGDREKSDYGNIKNIQH